MVCQCRSRGVRDAAIAARLRQEGFGEEEGAFWGVSVGRGRGARVGETGVGELRSARVSHLSRIASRVRQGGHNVPRSDVLRRFKRGWTNFLNVYQPLADNWAIYENSESKPRLLERRP